MGVFERDDFESGRGPLGSFVNKEMRFFGFENGDLLLGIRP